MPSTAPIFDEPAKLASSLPARLIGEPLEEYKEKYGLFVNPVSDRAKYKHIDGKDQIRVYVSGVFDMFHFGHARYLMQAKNMFPNTYLICGVSGGSTTHELKGQTVFTQEERLECVRHCRYVDEVLCPSPWFQTLEFLQELKVDFTVQNPEPYPCGDVADIYQPLKDAGLFLPTLRTEGVSTSDFITRIISAYDLYLERNLLRGVSRHDLGINFLTEKRMQVARQVDIVSKKINGLIAGFIQFFYAPISDRIVEYLSPPPTLPDNSEPADNQSGIYEDNRKTVSVPDRDALDERIRMLCHLYLGWPTELVSVRPLGKGCTNHVIIATLTADGETTPSFHGNKARMDGNDLSCFNDGLTNKDQEGFLEEFDYNRAGDMDDNKKTVTREVLVKLYGSVIPGKLATDVYVNCYLGSMGRIPKILGLFEGGRIEEFLPSTCISHDNFRLQYRKIVKMIMEFQSLSMPVPKEVFLVKQLKEFSDRVTVDREFWVGEVDWYLDILSKIDSNMQLSFCHNDVSMNNLLVPNSDPENLVLIDWEYASHNYSLFDIANYCCQHQYDLSHPVAPFFQFNDQWLPCDAVLLDILNIYKTSTTPPVHTPYMELLAQLKFMIMGSELFWTLWALTLEVSYNIDLTDYLAAKRNGYFLKKELYADVIEELVLEKSTEKSIDHNSPEFFTQGTGKHYQGRGRLMIHSSNDYYEIDFVDRNFISRLESMNDE